MKKRKNRQEPSAPKPKFHCHPDQSWSCTGCGKCCTMWDVPVTREEKERIESLEIPGFDFKKEKFFVPVRRSRGRLFMISKRDEQCVFLGDDGLCVIHKHHGEAVKALACRLYPFHILQWVDGSVSVSFRFDCSAVSENTGAKILEREGEISKLLAELRQSDLQSRAKFSVNIADQPPLANMRETSETYLSVFQCSDATLAVKLHYMVSLVEFHSSSFGAEHVLRMEEDFKSDATAYFGEHLDEFAYLISEAEPHDRIVEMIFNYLLSGFARVDEEVRSKSFVTGRLGRIAPVLRFIMSKGSLRTLSREYPDTTGVSAFSALERAVLDWESNKVIDRYLAVQLRSLHFCGNPGPDLTFEEGVRHLALAVAAIISLAAFYANDEQQSKSVDASSPETPLFVTGAHTAAALRIVDHTFYHSPFFGLRHVRRMTKWLISERKFPSILKLIDSALAVSAGVSN